MPKLRAGSSVAEHHAVVHDQILDAGHAVISEVGYGGATLAMVAERVGMSRNALYRYVDDKADLLGQLMDREVARFVDALRREFADLDDPAAEIARFVDRQLRYFARQQAMAHDLAGSLGATRHAELMDRLRPLRELIADVVRRGIDAGTFRAADPDMITELVLSAVSAERVQLARGDVDLESTIATTTAFVLAGLTNRS